MGAINMTVGKAEGKGKKGEKIGARNLDRIQCLRMFEGRILRATRGSVPQSCIPRAQPPGRPTNDALQLLERLFGSGRRRFSHSFSRVCVRAPPYRFSSST